MEEEEHMDTDDASNASFPAELVVAALGGTSIAAAVVSATPNAEAQEQENCLKPVEQQLKDMALEATPESRAAAAAAAAALHTTTSSAAARTINIPYILNGELYEIQTQEGENVTVKCCHCPPDRVYRGSVRSTGNFHMHIKRRHPDLLGKLHDMKVNALLERRDRLMRNRKVPTTASLRRGGSGVVGGGGASRINANLIKQELLQTPQPPQLSLKIRTAFQRHQLQQQQQLQQEQQQLQQHKQLQQKQEQQHNQHQQDQQNWDAVVAAPFVVAAAAVASNTNAPEMSSPEQPLDYSLKESAEGRDEHPNFSSTMILCANPNAASSESSEVEESVRTMRILVPMPAEKAAAQHEGSAELLPNAGRQTVMEAYCCNNNNEQQLLQTQQQQFYNESAVAAALMRRCSTRSSLSSCGSNLSIGGNIDHNNNNNSSNNNSDHYFSQSMTAIVKSEPLLLVTTPPPPQQAIDLSMQSSVSSSSGIGSAGISFGSGCNNNNNNNNRNNMNAVSSGTEAAAAAILNLQWQELLLQVESSMRELQREMCARNQIETNRIFLDIAKFKYLHPGFNFQC